MAVDLVTDETLTVTDDVEDPLLLEVVAAPTANVPVEA